MGKQILPEDAGDIDTLPEIQLSDEELKVYVDGPPKDDRTTTIQNSFIQLHIRGGLALKVRNLEKTNFIN